MKDKFSLILSVVAIVISIVAICHVFPSSKSLDFDYLGLIVGILSLLVTGLLGWQIFNFFSIENRLKKLESFSNDFNRSVANLNKSIERERHFCKAYVGLIDNQIAYRESKNKDNPDIRAIMNCYLAYLENFKALLLSGDAVYPALCLIYMDSILSDIIELKSIGIDLPANFNDLCDKLYNEISSLNPQMNDGDMDFFHSIRMRRKSIYTDNPLPPQTNPWGIRGNSNRL